MKCFTALTISLLVLAAFANDNAAKSTENGLSDTLTSHFPPRKLQTYRPFHSYAMGMGHGMMMGGMGGMGGMYNPYMSSMMMNPYYYGMGGGMGGMGGMYNPYMMYSMMYSPYSMMGMMNPMFSGMHGAMMLPLMMSMLGSNLGANADGTGRKEPGRMLNNNDLLSSQFQERLANLNKNEGIEKAVKAKEAGHPQV